MGKKTVELLIKQGYQVFALDQNVEEIEGNVVPIKIDVTDEKSIEDAYLQIQKSTDELEAIIHYAGVYMLNSLVEMDYDNFEKIFKINVFGVYSINKILLPLLKRESKIIITTSELAPLDPLPFTGIYAVTKAALEKYAYSLRMELQLLGIDVSVIRAGAVATNMLGSSTSALDKFCNSTQLYQCNAKRFKQIVDSVEAKSIDPTKIALLSYKILKKKHPKFAYSINNNFMLKLLNMLPKRMQLFIIRQILKK